MRAHPAPADQAAEHPESVPADGEGLRGLLRHMASPVVVVTCVGASGARGATIGSFASASLAPPMVTFNVTRGTRLHDALGTAPGFAVSLLAADQAATATRFAVPDLEDQFDGVEHARTPLGLPVLRGTMGTLLCRVRARVDAGDHTVIVGEVEEIAPGEGGEPLLYYRQSYRGVGREV